MQTTIKKRINRSLYVLSSLYPFAIGGMEIFNYYFLNHQLNESDDTIYYLTPERTASEKGNYIPLRKIWPVRISYPFQFFFLIWKLRRKIDFTYISYAQQSWIISYSQSLILRLFRIPYIITIHSGKEPVWKFSYPFRSYFRHAGYVVGVSEPICAAFEKIIPRQSFHYIPPLIPFEKSKKTKEEIKNQLGFHIEDRVLLYVGSIKGMKNPDKIVTAISKIDPGIIESKKIKVLFVGSGDMENALKEMVGSYQLNSCIRIAGLVSRENIPDYYKMADAYVISSDYEGTSLSLMEAMFNKLAIIGSDAPGINRMLTHGQNALLYKTNDTDDLANTIIRIFSDPELMIRISANAFAGFNEKYSFEAMMRMYNEIFSSIAR